ncbi:MAG: ABC transporter ATP-binding protein [Defluviitaleaceae bacterium]|nr:ABC transporter ATP-binding protein [Defluviitaleaceae bacterium]
MTQTPILQITALSKTYKKSGLFISSKKKNAGFTAVKDIDLTLYQGEVLGLVGESGSGKSTLGRAILQLIRPTKGSVIFEGTELTTLPQKELRKKRLHMQYIFQDPKNCLNPTKTIGWLLKEPLIAHGITNKNQRQKKVMEMLEMANLDSSYLTKYPSQLSGGQAQRIALMTALILKPKFVVADEPVSSLDTGVQARILNFINELKKEMNLTILFITHDLALCHYMSDRIAVMYLGNIVELGEAVELYKTPMHPYTQMLFASIISVDDHKEISGSSEFLQTDPKNTHVGCSFYDNCPKAMPKCKESTPQFYQIPSQKRQVRCFLYERNFSDND